jgi:hypothetical protein
LLAHIAKKGYNARHLEVSVLKKILIALAVIVIAFVAFVATRPATYRVERSTIVNASPAVVFPYVNRPKEFVSWSPWEKLDPNNKTTYSGPDEGVGAAYAWQGNSEVGSGKMTIIESKANEMVQQDLEFIEPFASKSTVMHALAPAGEGTKVSWIMEGNNDFMGKLFGVFMNMDTMIGKDFDEGLANLKRLVEAKAKEAPPPPAPPVGDVPQATDAGPAVPVGDAPPVPAPAP